MVIKQVLADFQIPETRTTGENDVVNIVTELLRRHIGVTGPTMSTDFKGFGRLLIYEDGDKSQCTVRFLPDGLVTIDIIFNVDSRNDNEVVQVFNDLKKDLKKSSLVSTDVIPPITRGRDIKNYHDTSDGRLKEYDFDEVVYRGSSDYQDILVVHSPQFGNMLFLDDTEMLADSDIAYTRAILGNGRESFENKTVLILGGGDGGILHEVLKEDPKFVTMVEIDQLVIDVARKHLRNICGSTMDSSKGSNYEIIVQDCFVELHKYIKEGRVFDYILNDLTDLPIGTDCTGIQTESRWDFIKDVLDLSLQALDKNGKYFAQGTNGANNHLALEHYEKILSTASCSVEYTKEFVFVPSFLELWTFYEVWKK